MDKRNFLLESYPNCEFADILYLNDLEIKLFKCPVFCRISNFGSYVDVVSIGVCNELILTSLIFDSEGFLSSFSGYKSQYLVDIFKIY